MSSSMKPLKLYSHAGGPNPWKLVIILNELNIPYDSEFPKAHEEPYISINPNGRFPSIEDPNTGITLWESGSIIEYVLETYDKEHKLSYTSFPEKYQQSNWKHFQMSGQGPYFGQLAWFSFFHPEKNLTSVTDRYRNEVKRVWNVIDYHLTKTGKPYLVGDKICFADLMFVTWNVIALAIVGDEAKKEIQEKSPKAWDWHHRLMERDSVKKAYEAQEKVKAELAAAGH